MIGSLMFASPTVEKFEGVARDDRGALRYRDQHEVRREGGRTLRAVTRCFDPQGRLSGVLRSEYGEDQHAPSYTFADATGARSRPRSSRPAASSFASRTDRSGSRSTATGAFGARTRAQSARARSLGCALARGRGGDVGAVAIPSRFDVCDSRIERFESDDRNLVRLRVGIDNWLLAMIAPSLEVQHDRKTRRLFASRGRERRR